MPARKVSVSVPVVLMLVAALSAIGAAWAGVVLADIYRPHAPGADITSLSADLRSSDSWSDWHLRATVVFLLMAALAALSHLQGAERGMRHRAVVTVCSVVAVVAALVTLLTRRLVEWDQLALRSVTVGADVSGYWFAAFDDDLRFILLGNTQVSQSQYLPAVLVHLGAPMVGAAMLVIGGFTLMRSSQGDPVPG